MPLYFRNSIKVGPFRINLSSAGVGLSVGIRGFRVGVGPKGHYVHAGANGIYYRQTGVFKKRAGPNKPSQGVQASRRSDDEQLSYVTDDGVVMHRVISGPVEAMRTGSRREAVETLNEARQRPPLFAPIIAVGGFALIWSWVTYGSTLATAAAVLVALLSSLAWRLDAGRRGVVFAYDLDDSAKQTYEGLTRAMDAMGRAERLWHIDSSGVIDNFTAWKRNAGASRLISKKATAIRYEVPPGVHTNVTPPSIRIDGKQLYFLPDCVLVREGSLYGSVSYQDLRVGTRPSRFIVEDAVPRDSEVVGWTWKHPRKDGGPDRRFANNRQLPICLFEEMGLLSSSGFKAALMISARPAASSVDAALNVMSRTTLEVRAATQVLLDYRRS
jgi:hypothetical protein